MGRELDVQHRREISPAAEPQLRSDFPADRATLPPPGIDGGRGMFRPGWLIRRPGARRTGPSDSRCQPRRGSHPGAAPASPRQARRHRRARGNMRTWRARHPPSRLAAAAAPQILPVPCPGSRAAGRSRRPASAGSGSIPITWPAAAPSAGTEAVLAGVVAVLAGTVAVLALMVAALGGLVAGTVGAPDTLPRGAGAPGVPAEPESGATTQVNERATVPGGQRAHGGRGHGPPSRRPDFRVRRRSDDRRCWARTSSPGMRRGRYHRVGGTAGYRCRGAPRRRGSLGQCLRSLQYCGRPARVTVTSRGCRC